MKKRIISVLLALCMVLSIVPVMTFATETDVDMSEMNALEAIGFDTSKPPEGFDANDPSNPYGRDSVTLNPVNELMLLQSTTSLTDASTVASNVHSTVRGHYDGTITDYQTLFQKTVSGYSLAESRLNAALIMQIISTSRLILDPYGVDYTPRSTCAAMAAAAANFDGNDGGIKKQYALVTMEYTYFNGFYAPVMKLQLRDATAGQASSDAQSLTLIGDFDQFANPHERYLSTEHSVSGPALKTMAQFHLQNYLKVAAGDFNGDGMDEVAVYVPEASNPRIEVYQYQKTTGASKTSYQNMQTNWSLAWTYPLKKTDDKVPNMVTLLAADVNRDGLDDLAVTYGYFYGALAMGGFEYTQSRAAVLYGSNSAAEPLSVYDDFAVASSSGTPIARAAFTYGPLVGVDQESLVLGGQSMGDLDKKNFNSRYAAVYQYDGEGFGIVTDQNYDLFAKDDDGNYVYSIMERSRECFYSLPYAPANLTVISNGLSEAATLYFDSLQLKYSEAGLELTGTLDVNSEWQSGHSGSSYVEFGASSSDLFGYGYDAMATMLYYPGSEWGYNTFGDNPDDTAGTRLNMIVTEATPVEDGEGVEEEEKFTTSTSIKSERISTTNLSLHSDFPDLFMGKTVPVISSAAYFIFPNTDKDTAYLKYNKSHYFVYSDPKVLAVLASSPYFEDLMNRDDLSGAYIQSETSYAQTAGSSDGAVAQASIWAGAYAALEQDITIFGIKIGSIECSSTIKAKFTYEFEMNSSLEQTVEYSTSVGADAVVLYSIPTVVYEYTAYTPDGKGGYHAQAMTVNSPHTASIQVMDLKKYEEIARDYAELPQISGEIMTHTLGDPSTYPTSTKGYKDAIVWNGDYAAVGYTDAPNGQNITQSIDMSTEYSHSFVFSSEAEYTAGVGVGALTVGVVAGSEAGAGYVMTSTSGSSYTASMQNMPAEAEEFGYGFSWKLFAYDGGGFPVVSYLVTDIEMPPELPDDFATDAEQTTDHSIALTWSYDKMISGFQLYRYYDFPDGSGNYELAFVPFDQGKRNEDGTWDFIYHDENLSPYTEYCYKIQAVRSVAPNLSIESEGMTVRTKTDVGYPDIELVGLDDGVLSIYPDSTNTVAVVVKNAGDYEQGISYQWQKLEDGKWVDLNNKKQAYYTFLSSGYSTEGDYRCRVNVVYYDSARGEEYFISAYSDVFHAKYRVHKAGVVGELTADTENGKPFASVTLKSTTAGHKAAPSGIVIFEITGLNYSRTYSAALKARGTNATASLTTDMTSELPEGAYTLRAYYQGSRVFAPLNLGQVTVLSGDEGYRLIVFDESGNEVDEMVYGTDWTAGFIHYQRVDGKLVEEKLSGWQSGTKLYRLGGSGSWLNSGTAGSSTGTWDWPGAFSANYDNGWPWLAQTPCRSFKLVKNYNDVDYEAYFKVTRRPLTVGVTTVSGNLTAAQGNVESNLPKPCVVDGSLVYGDKLQYDNLVYASDGTSTMTGTNFVDLRVYDTAGREVTLDNSTPPGSYTVIGYLNPSNIIRIETNTTDENGAQPHSSNGQKYRVSGITYGGNYETRFAPATYVVTGKSYTLSANVVNTTDRNAPGTLSLVSPEAHSFEELKQGVKLANGAGLLLLAQPYDGYQVKQWIVKKNGTEILTQKGGDTLIYTMLAEDITVELQYELATYTLNVTCDPAMGSVKMPVGLVNGAVVRPGAEFTFTAAANPGYQFKHWEYVVGGRIELITTPEISIVMPKADVNLYPVFEREVFTLTLGENLRASYKWDDDSDTSTPEINRYVTSGAEIAGDTEVTVSAAPGYKVSGNWQVNGSPIEHTEETYTFAMTEDTSISAETALGLYTLDLERVLNGRRPTDFPQGQIHVTSEMLDEATGEPIDSTTLEQITNIPGNTEFTLTAIAPRGYKLLRWDRKYDGGRAAYSYDETIHYTMQRNETLAAVFNTVREYNVWCNYRIAQGMLTYRLLDQNGAVIEQGTMESSTSISFYANETLEVTATPKANYMVDKWTVNDEVESGNHSKTRTFTAKDIPAGWSFLAIEVEFAPQSYYTVNYAVEGTGGVITKALTDSQPFESGSPLVGGGSAVSITAQPDDGMMVDSWKINGEVATNSYGYAQRGNVLNIDSLSSDQSTVNITVSFKGQVGYEVFGVDDVDSHVFWRLKNVLDVLKTGDGKFLEGQTLIYEVKPDNGYRLIEVNGFDEIIPLDDGKWRCIIYAISQDVTVSARISELYDLTCVQPENGTVAIDKTQAIEGETVTVTATPDEGYELVSVLLSDSANPEAAAERIEGNTFEMPARDVQVSAAFALKHYEIICASAENGAVTTDPTTAQPGQTVTVTATPDEGYELVSLQLSDPADPESPVEPIEGNTFVMPEKDVQVSATFALKYYEITCAPAENGTVTTDPTTAQPGQTVTITATPDEGFELKAISASYLADTAETELTIMDNTFVMPGAPVTVTAVFTAVGGDEGGEGGEGDEGSEGGTVVSTATLSFEVNGGEAVDAVRVKSGTTIDLAQYVTTRTGYEFGGWYRDRALTEKLTSIQLLADTMVYAKWEKPEEEINRITFKDVPEDAYYNEAVYWAVGEGITNGVGNNLFEPNEVCTRAQIVTFLWRAAGEPEPMGTYSFADVLATAYYAEAVCWAAEQGITNGVGNNLFEPEETCTRAQSVTFLWRFADSPKTSAANQFDDVPADAFYTQAVNWAVQEGITLGVGNNLFDPDAKCTRAETVTFLYRFKNPEERLTDEEP